MDVPWKPPLRMRTRNATIPTTALELEDQIFYSAIQTEVALFIQGANVLLVGIALYLLYRRRPAGACVLGSLISVMCILTTTAVILDAAATPLAIRTVYMSAAPSASLQRMSTVLALAEDLLLVTNNATADALLIYRCYTIWKNSKHRKVVALPVVLALVTTVVGYVFSCWRSSSGPRPDLRMFYALVVATNVTLTALIVGRILHARRSLQPTRQTKFTQRYNTAIKILVESAVIYLIGSLAIILQQSLAGFSTPIGTLYILVFQTLMNMVPALAVLQISFGHARPAEGCSCKSVVSV